MNRFKSHFKFSKQEQSGIFFLLLIVVVIQAVIYFRQNHQGEAVDSAIETDIGIQAQIDSLKKRSLQKDSIKIYPFNPNFITDYKGYSLGLSVEEIDRLHKFRERKKYVNSAKEFQRVTKVSDALLGTIAVYFKFPEWTQKNSKDSAGKIPHSFSSSKEYEKVLLVNDLNLATAEDLRKVNGIGEKLSARIIKFRNRLGGFLVNDQLYDVYGLEPEVVRRALKRFKVKSKPKIEPININSATSQELSKLIYINTELALRIIQYREARGAFSSMDELSEIQGFPIDKIHNIKLYLTH